MNRFGKGFGVPEGVAQTQAMLNQLRPATALGNGFRVPEYVAQTQSMLNQIRPNASIAAVGTTWTAMVPRYDMMGVQSMLASYTAQQEMILGHSLHSGAVVALTELSQWMLSIKMPNITDSVMPLINTSAFMGYNTTALSNALSRSDWSWLSEVRSSDLLNGEDFNTLESVSEDMITHEVREQIAADIDQVLSEPESMHITAREKFALWLKESPANALAFIQTLMTAIALLLEIIGLVWSARTAKDSPVYEQPTSSSNVVCTVTVNQNVTVINEAPYYYEVEFVDPETGEKRQGYVYKGNLVDLDVLSDAVDEPQDAEAQQ